MSVEVLKSELLAAIKRGAAQQRLVDASKQALDVAVENGLVSTAKRCHARWTRQLTSLDASKAEILELQARIAKEPDLLSPAAKPARR